MGRMNRSDGKPDWRRRLCGLSLNFSYLYPEDAQKIYSPPFQNMWENKRVNGYRIALAIVHRSSSSIIINDEHTIYSPHTHKPYMCRSSTRRNLVCIQLIMAEMLYDVMCSTTKTSSLPVSGLEKILYAVLW